MTPSLPWALRNIADAVAWRRRAKPLTGSTRLAASTSLAAGGIHSPQAPSSTK